MLRGTSLRERLVVPHSILPAALANAVIRLAESVGVGKGAAVERHAQDDFVCGDSAGAVQIECGLGVEWCGEGVGGVVVYVGLVTGEGGEAARVIVRHEIPEVQLLIHVFEVQDLDLVRTYAQSVRLQLVV